MAYRVELARRAERDLWHIFDFIHASESQAAAKWFNGLESRIQSLADFPNRGPAATDDPTLRYLLYGNKPHVYRILYRIEEVSQRVVIRHIRHGARIPLGNRKRS